MGQRRSRHILPCITHSTANNGIAPEPPAISDLVRGVRFRTSKRPSRAYLAATEIAPRRLRMQPRSRSETATGDFTMNTFFALLTTTVLVAGATTAMAAEQGSDEAAGYALSLQAARGFSGAQAGRTFGGAYASARMPGVHASQAIAAPRHHQRPR
jgi:hypothetical protein